MTLHSGSEWSRFIKLYFISVLKTAVLGRDFGFPPRCNSGFRYSRISRDIGCELITDVSGQPTDSLLVPFHVSRLYHLKTEPTGYPETAIISCQPTSHNIAGKEGFTVIAVNKWYPRFCVIEFGQLIDCQAVGVRSKCPWKSGTWRERMMHKTE
jgi:hypothetical protein